MTLPNVAYFSMEIAMDQSLKTYSGGLGFLAGSHMLSAGYLQMPMVGVTMLWSYGYYDQRIDHSGNVEVAYIRKYYDYLVDTGITVEVDTFGEKVKVKAFRVDPELLALFTFLQLILTVIATGLRAFLISFMMEMKESELLRKQFLVLQVLEFFKQQVTTLM